MDDGGVPMTAERADAREHPRDDRGRSVTRRTGLLVRRLATVALLALVVGLWATFLLPKGLGGSASYLIVSGHSMDGTYATGDLVVVREGKSYEIGDVVGYRVPEGAPGAGHLVIHRIVGGDEDQGFITQGDNNDEVDIWRPLPEDVLGDALVRVPGFGKRLVQLRTPVGLGVLAGALAFLVLVGGNGQNGETKDRGRDRKPRRRFGARQRVRVPADGTPPASST
jgi:signal peptidase I